MKRSPMTLRGAELLRAELKRLKAEDRPHVIKAIAEARAHGDLSENAEYHAAREQQGFIEGRINEIETRLANAEVIDVAQLARSDRVVFGATVDLEDQDDGSAVSYQIVGEDEADIRAGRISIASPIARALIGKKRGRCGRGRGAGSHAAATKSSRCATPEHRAAPTGESGLAARYSTATCPIRAHQRAGGLADQLRQPACRVGRDRRRVPGP